MQRGPRFPRRRLFAAAAIAAGAILAACEKKRTASSGRPLLRATLSPHPAQRAPGVLSLSLVVSATPTGAPFHAAAFGMVGVFDVDWLADPSFAPLLDNFAASPDAFTAVRFFGALNSGTKEKTTPDETSEQSAGVSKQGLQRFTPTLAGLAALTTRGLIPFVQLSFFPVEVSSSPRLPPASLDGWQTLVREFLDVLAADPRFGVAAMRDWWFEVWNEPNIPVFWQGTFDQYLDLYRATSAAVTTSGYPIRLGGPALAWLPASDAAAGGPLMRRFLQFLHDEPEVRCDFLSFHAKGTWINPAQGTDEPILSDLVTAAEETARMALAICPERCAGLPIINNEADMKVGFDIPYEPRMTERFPAWLAASLVAHDTLTARYRDRGLRFAAAADDANLQLVQAPFDGRRAVMTRASAADGDLFKVPVYHFYELLRLLGDQHGAITVGSDLCYPATDLFHLFTAADHSLAALLTVYPTDNAATEARMLDYTITDIPWPAVNIARFQIDVTRSNAYTAAGRRLAIPPPGVDAARAIRQVQELALFVPTQHNVPLTDATFRDRLTIAPYTTLLSWITPYTAIVPTAPRGVSVNAVAGNVTLRWEPNREASFFSYEVYEMRDGEQPGELLSPVPLRAAYWVDTAPPGPRRYAVRVVSASGIASPLTPA